MKLVSEQFGSGEPVLLIHGMGSAATAWKLIIPELRKTNLAITVDLPGHGKSPMNFAQPMDPKSLAELVFRNMDELGIDKFHVVGNSLGGWIALEMAALKPERIKSLLGVAPAGLWLTPFTSRTSARTRVLSRLVNPIAPFTVHFESLRKLGFESVSPLWRNFSHQTCLDATRAMANAAGYYPAWDAMLKKRFNGKIPTTVPTTIIFGDADNSLPAQSCQERSLAPAHAKWIIFSECGHAPMWDHPEEVLIEINNLIGISN